MDSHLPAAANPAAHHPDDCPDPDPDGGYCLGCMDSVPRHMGSMTEHKKHHEREADANPAAQECEIAVLVKYAGTKREHTIPYIMPVSPWCKTHDEPRVMCELRKRIRALEAELAYRRSYDTGDFTSVKKVIVDLQAERDALKASEARVAELEYELHLHGRCLVESCSSSWKVREREE